MPSSFVLLQCVLLNGTWTIPLKSNKSVIHARPFIVFKCNVSHTGDKKQKWGSNYGMLRSVDPINGANITLEWPYNHIQQGHFR